VIRALGDGAEDLLDYLRAMLALIDDKDWQMKDFVRAMIIQAEANPPPLVLTGDESENPWSEAAA
jgi:hypothetical protein